MNNHVTQSPLTWPAGWKRTSDPIDSRLGKWNKKITIAHASSFVIAELARMGIPQDLVIISTNLRYRQDGLPYSNQKDPDDSGVSVWWTDSGTDKIIALDQYCRIADNLYAIGKTSEAMRGIKRWGGSEILDPTFTGFTALPDNSEKPQRTWREVLNYHGHTFYGATSAYRKARSADHPYTGGSDEEFRDVQDAWNQAKFYFGDKS